MDRGQGWEDRGRGHLLFLSDAPFPLCVRLAKLPLNDTTSIDRAGDTRKPIRFSCPGVQILSHDS